MATDDRRRAAEMARQLRAGLVSFREFARAFGRSDDESIASLYDLIEHEPAKGGFFGISKSAFAKYQRQIEDAIRALEEEP